MMKVVGLRVALGMCCLFLFAVQSSASNFEGMEAYRQNDFKTAMRTFKACSDDVKCLYMLGIMFEKGEGVKQDYAEAAKWYQKAADKDDELSQYRLGRLLEKGLGVEENLNEAIKLYRKSAKKNNSNARQALKRLENN